MDGPLMRAAFPDAAIEQAGYWKDLAKLGTTAVFERIVLVNRNSAHKQCVSFLSCFRPRFTYLFAHVGSRFGGVWFKMIAGTMNVSAPDDFWAPVRASVWQNVLGAAPGQGVEKDSVPGRPLVTYISRQGSGRRLVEKDHEGLVAALRELESAGICEFELAAMERLTLRDQIELVSRSTVSLISRSRDELAEWAAADLGWCSRQWTNTSAVDAPLAEVHYDRNTGAKWYRFCH